VLRILILNGTGRPKRLFVFVNPFGGRKFAANIFRDQVKPLLEDAQVHLTVQGFDIFLSFFLLLLLLL